MHLPFSKDTKYFLACSGGVDSMVLAYLLLKSKVDFEILHVNFQLRAKDSDKDETLVVDFGKMNQIKTHVIKFDTKYLHKQNGGNLEELCRKLRYEWFDTFLNTHPKSQLVLGHHLDDQVETFYWQISRKAGIVGLSSLKKNISKIIRPLLDFSKHEIYAFAKKHKIVWREDYTNHEINFTRNKLRNVFIPYIEHQIPTIKTSIQVLIAAFQTTKQTIESTILSEVELSEQFEITLEIYSKWDIDTKYVFLNLLNIRANCLNELEKLQSSAIGKYIVFDEWSISKKLNSLSFDKMKKLEIPTLNIEPISVLPEHFSKGCIYLDADKIKGELKVRLWENKDKLKPIGQQGSKLVSKILNEFHLSAYQKKHVLVVHDEEHIHWIVGYKIGRMAVAGLKTNRIVKVSISENQINSPAEFIV